MSERSKRPRTKRTLSNEEIIRLYNAGERTEDIAKKANVSARYIRMILKKENILKRPHGSWKRRYMVMELPNIKPKKSLDLKFPHVPEQYLSHFVRGYIVGDGCIYEHKEFVNIVGGSLNFMESLFDILVNQWIYDDKGLYLKRKYNRFTENRLLEKESKWLYPLFSIFY
ncbi:hypothetical protein [Halobacillus naozhouensis]|uniref:DOD-type homing endonuclease domain-containing protein n=1 Tax=Halobacillus naozhouensis TaxID=554880 RepID=A0ABY8ISU9_9BACI|nr:hypothetical protein [Halobacillus naozhouensis]WFT73005.1 hypothetical protein P9989_11335 [Halobacillus naozhouensis]